LGDRFRTGSPPNRFATAPFDKMPLDYERAFGGTVAVNVDRDTLVDIREPINPRCKGWRYRAHPDWIIDCPAAGAVVAIENLLPDVRSFSSPCLGFELWPTTGLIRAPQGVPSVRSTWIWRNGWVHWAAPLRHFRRSSSKHRGQVNSDGTRPRTAAMSILQRRTGQTSYIVKDSGRTSLVPARTARIIRDTPTSTQPRLHEDITSISPSR
jgi:hypothetical protein